MTRRLPANGTDAVRVAAGVAGVVAAHAFDYLVVFPDTAQRTHALAATGHRYWPLAATAAILATAIAAVAAAIRGASSRRTDADADRLLPRFAALARFQVGLFAAVEVTERVAAHVSPAGLVRERSFALGMVLQLVVAATVVVILAGIEKLARRVAAAIRRPAPAFVPPRTTPRLAACAVPAGHRTGGHARAPPVLAV
ncbi:MAG: hypothetical protein QOG64_467 [Acidimicrobiaceae bacterium]|nr:hypothetical protein [Acidimicrobiaceae bacterium]